MRLFPPRLYAAAGVLLLPGFLYGANPEPLALDPAGDASGIDVGGAPAEKPFHRLALGISYTGAQLRWRFKRRWAVEARYQQGQADSDYGEVTAHVYSLRGYRFFHADTRMPLFIAPEIGHTESSSAGGYSVHGFVMGVVGGFDYYVSRRLSVGVDVGPYVISLNERVTGTSQSNVDFVLNTSLNWHLF